MSVPRAIGRGDLGGATVNLNGANETLIVTSDPVPMPLEVSLVFIMAALSWTAGASTTGMKLRIRRGNSLASTQVGQTYDHAATGGSDNSAVIFATDELFNAYTAQYSLTLEATAATANGTANSASILVITF